MIRLQNDQLETVREILREHVPNAEVHAYGSRTLGKANDWSDLDLIIITPEKLPFSTLTELKLAFEESDLPFRVDIIDQHRTSDDFIKLIQEEWEQIQAPA